MDLACLSLFAEQWPDLCRAVDHYCERTSAAFNAEPVNALTNFAFPIGAVLLWIGGERKALRNGRGLVAVLIVMMAAVGFGSLLFHTLGTRWAEWGDVIPILVFILLYLWFVLIHLVRWPAWAKAAFLAVFLLATVYLEAGVPGTFLWGGALYIPTLLSFVAIGLALKWQAHPAGGAMLAAIPVFLAAYSFRSLDHAICAAFPLGTHFLWHLLNALLLFLLIRLAIRTVSSGDQVAA